MAYQINGNVVIDDNGKGIIENLPVIATPFVDSPTLDEILPTGDFTITASDFSGIYQTFYASQFEVANVNTFAAANIVYDSGNIIPGNTSVTVGAASNRTGNLFVRVRYFSTDNVDSSIKVSAYSSVRSFYVTPPPSTLGESYGGGYYAGAISIGGGVCYYLIVAPNATGCACCQWKTTRTASPAGSNCDGYNNTYPYFVNNAASYPAGNFTATRSIGGFEDWYLPSLGELAVLRGSAGNMPAGEGWQLGEPCPLYWSSQQSSGNPVPSGFSFYFNFANGSPGPPFNKQYRLRTRSIRRIPK